MKHQSPNPVHPRLRGELTVCLFDFLPSGGSSPLTRGTHSSLLREFLCTRFIPAYAGNSCLSTIPKCSLSVHPRLRGELISSCVSAARFGGSSPLTRGTRFAAQQVSRDRLVHPRLRGELEMRTTSEKSEFGSSPLTRGTLLGGCGTGKTHRFIPAYAGNSERPQSVCQRRTVHPRLRGELL